MSVQTVEASDDLLTIDELAAAVGMTVRTTRYYASLGLLPAPVRRGRVAYYDRAHRARLQMVRALQDHGFTLQAIERYMVDIPDDASVEDLALQSAMLTSWSPQVHEEITRRQLDKQAGRTLTDAEVDLLVLMGTLDRTPQGFRSTPNLSAGVELLDLDIPVASMGAAGEAIRRHMEELASELTTILRVEILEPFRREPHSAEEAVQLESTMSRLRQLTLEAVVTGFQRAANDVIRRSLSRD